MSLIHGSTVADGAVRNGLPEAGPVARPAPRVRVSYWCANEHRTAPAFAAGAEIPDLWECPQCGQAAGHDRANPPPRQRTEPYKRHLDYLKERRTGADGAAILAAALGRREAARLAGFSTDTAHHEAASARPGPRAAAGPRRNPATSAGPERGA